MTDSMEFRAGWLFLHDGTDGRPVRVRVEHVSGLREFETHDKRIHTFVMTTGGSLIDVRDSLAEVEKEYERARSALGTMVSNISEADALPMMFLGNRPHPISLEEVRRRSRELIDSLPKRKRANKRVRKTAGLPHDPKEK
jgi:hypothetical protein